jgi:hypothetical protein
MKTSLEDQKRFLDAVRGDVGVGWAAINSEQLEKPTWRQWACTDNDAILSRLSRSEDGGRFFGLAQYHSDRNRTKDNVASVKSVLLDVDPNERYTHSGACIDALFKFSEDVSLPLSYIADSGNGAHGYITLKEAIPLDDWLLLANDVEAVAGERGLVIDKQVTRDAARAPRLPGTDNMKFGLPRRETQIIHPSHPDDSPVLYDRQTLALKFTPQKVSKTIEVDSLIGPASEEQIESVRSALDSISVDCEYNIWLRVIFALKSTGWRQAKCLAREWTAKRRKYQVKKFERIWRSAKPDGQIRIYTLYWYAQQSGWTESIPNTGGGLILQTDGNVVNNASNVHELLKTDPELKDLIGFNSFNHRRQINAFFSPVADAPKQKPQSYPRSWSDGDTVAVMSYLQRGPLPKATRASVEDGLVLRDQEVSFHPLQDYLEALQWDGVERVGNWLVTYTSSTKQPADYLQFVGTAFLISAVARAFKPGAKVDTALILEGKTYLGKSGVLELLAGDEFFSDNLTQDLRNKDAAVHCLGRWIIEMPEMAHMSKNEVEVTKAFLTRRTDRFRPPYGRNEVEVPRSCVFAGTSNRSDYLADPTGNRRFWPVHTTAIDLDKLAVDRDQLWAEAVVLFRQGHPWHTNDPELLHLITVEQEGRVVIDPWQAQITHTLDSMLEEDLEGMRLYGITPGELLTNSLQLETNQKHIPSAKRVGMILINIDWQKGKKDRVRGQVFYPPEDWTPAGREACEPRERNPVEMWTVKGHKYPI